MCSWGFLANRGRREAEAIPGAAGEEGGVSKRSAIVIHLNWKKASKREWLVRDNLWFLDEELRCRQPQAFDPYEVVGRHTAMRRSHRMLAHCEP